MNTLAGPGTFVLHAGAYKQFLLTERVRAILEGTFTNILNHPSYALPNSDIRIRERGYHPVYLVDLQRRTAEPPPGITVGVLVRSGSVRRELNQCVGTC